MTSFAYAKSCRFLSIAFTARNVDRLLAEGMQIFRFDTFGSEEFWGGKVKLHRAKE